MASLLPIITLCLFVALLSTTAALRPMLPFFRHNLHRQHEKMFIADDNDQSGVNCSTDPNIEEKWFTQKLDQFAANDQKTYGQRYYVNWKFYDKNASQPPVFLMIGGEGEMSIRWSCWENYTYMQLAKENKAIVVQLEHRFFGLNKDMPDLSTPNLVYLTSEQALADIAAFIPAFNAQYNLTSPRWVAFGGSYPGSLAAWLRVKYPNITVGNVASSAPLWPKVNFWEYSDVMERTINDTSVDCYKNVGQAFKELKALTYTKEGRDRLNEIFKLEPTLEANSDDITTLFGYVFGAFQGIIQYTYDARNTANLNGLNIMNACKMMNDDQGGKLDLVQRLASVADWDAKKEDPDNYNPKVDVSYMNNLKPFLNTSLAAPGASMRGWMWLSCNEFGWLQTTDKGNSLFGDILSLGSFMKLCIDLFGPPMTNSYIEQQVAKARDTFGTSWTYNATNVILPNGAFDPWSALGTTMSNPDRHQIAITTPGAAHCSDMYPAYKDEPVKLAETRKRVREEVNYYLNASYVPQQPEQNNGAIYSGPFLPQSLLLFVSIALFVMF
ncbi:serine carboxypeptidase s28 domain-containing protein [Ditylenchus destructor]|nr:serine carboxypeptidase s28 domain-containing protein [Ditylenchus destructor]